MATDSGKTAYAIYAVALLLNQAGRFATLITCPYIQDLKRMLLEKIILENFRQFLGRQEVSFSTSPNKNVTIIYGINGTGKTNLFNAINWCLYGKKRDKNSSAPGIEIQGTIASWALIRELHDGDKRTVATEIYFSYGGDKYNARREVICYKLNDELKLDDNSENFSLVKINGPSDSKPVPNPINTINSILPQTTAKYFFFDGERINELTRSGKESLASIVAMANDSGSNAPFIIDTPFGRTSKESKAHVAKYISELTRQLVLLVTDTELTPEAQKELMARTGKEYTLSVDNILGITKIEVGKHV